MQVVATPDTDLFFILTPLVQGHIIPFLLVACLWNLFSLSVVESVPYKYLHVKFAENKQLTVRGLFVIA